MSGSWFLVVEQRQLKEEKIVMFPPWQLGHASETKVKERRYVKLNIVRVKVGASTENLEFLNFL